jgi:general L-amino acid transport system substrate-binding protein
MGYTSPAGGKPMRGFVIGAITALLSSQIVLADTLETVRARGYLACGASPSLPGFSSVNDKGEQEGTENDYCRALAAAIFGDPAKVKFTVLPPRDVFTVLQSGAIDIFAGHATRTFSRDVSLGVGFATIYLYDGQGFMVTKKSGIKSVQELNGASICLTQGSSSELSLADYFSANKMTYTAVAFADSEDDARRAYEEGRCDAWTTDRSILAARGIGLKNREQHFILPEVITKSPIGPVVRHGDDRWRDIAYWTLGAMLLAEENGITSKNVDHMKSTSKDAQTQRLLGSRDNMGTMFGLSQDWAYQIISKVGNYAEVWDRNVGPSTRLGLERGANALSTKGGLMYVPPFR